MFLQKSFYILIFLCISVLAVAQSTTLTGIVTDAESGDPLISVNVQAGEKGTVTDLEGKYTLELPNGDYKIIFTYVGFGKEERDVSLKGGAVTLDVQLGSGETITEVVVRTDRAIDRKTPIAFSNISTEKINEELAAQDIPMILNSIPGSYATQSGGGDGDARITIRGFNQRNVAVMLDGVPVNDMENGWVYWSNWFGLDLVTKDIQVQRGLGASKLAIPSIGGTINIMTNGIEAKRSVKLKQEVGNNGALRTTFGYTSGRTEKGWGVSVGGSYKQGDGWVEGTFTKGYFYYLRVDKMMGDHLLSFSGFGAPQSHGQRSFTAPIALYDTAHALKVGVPQEAIDQLIHKDKGLRYNQHLGVLNGEELNTRQNYYHKPQLSLKHSWNVNDKLYWSNVAYLSIGNGGGVGPYDGPNVTDDGYMDLQPIYDLNTSTSIFKPDLRSDNILRASVNNHFWYGLLSTFRYTINPFLSLSGGVDVRYYEGEHNRIVYDLMGGEYFRSEGNLRIDQRETKLYEGDKYGYDNTGFVKWGGLFGLIEYSQDKISAFVNLSTAQSGYSLEDRMKAKVVNLADTTVYVTYEDPVKVGDETYTVESPEAQNQRIDWTWFPSFTFKTGASYNINEKNNVFVNTGYLSRAQRFVNVIRDNRFNTLPVQLFDNVQNEKILAFELGYGYKSQNFSTKVNGYITNWLNKPLDSAPTVLEDPSDPESDRIPYNVNGISAVHRGVEMDFAYRINKKLTVEGLASFGDWIWNSSAVATLPDGGTFEFDAEGVHVGDAAQIQLGGLVRYAPIERLYLKLKTTYFGKNYANFNPEDLKGATGGFESWKLPSYNLLDFHAGYTFNIKTIKTSVRFNVLNLLNATYIADARNNDRFTQSYNDFDAKSAAVFFGQGRRWNMSLQFAF